MLLRPVLAKVLFLIIIGAQTILKLTAALIKLFLTTNVSIYLRAFRDAIAPPSCFYEVRVSFASNLTLIVMFLKNLSS